MSTSPLTQDVTIFCHPYTECSQQSHTLLRRAASLYSGLPETALGPLETTEWGKPFFPCHPNLNFSISHSGEWWLCGFSSAPLGLDVQIHKVQAPLESLSRRFFHPSEDTFLAADGYRRFFDLWCAKESWVKYIGEGFFRDPDSFSVVAADGTFPSAKDADLRLLPFHPGYSLCLCARQIGAVTIRDF